jgi:hypothetical protein
MFATVLAFAAVVTAVGGWVLFQAMNSVAKSARNPKLFRGSLIFLTVFYVVNTIIVFSGVVSGSRPPYALVGLPIPILMMWFFWRSAMRTARLKDLGAEKEKSPEARTSEPPGQNSKPVS